MKVIQIKINKPIRDYPPGAIARVPVDDVGVPLEKFWRDRLRDAEIDSCVEVVEETRPKTLNKDKEKS